MSVIQFEQGWPRETIARDGGSVTPLVTGNAPKGTQPCPNFIQRSDKSEGDAIGCDYLEIWTGKPGCSPIWSVKERAAYFQNADEVAAEIARRYGYALIVGSNVNEEKQRILAEMKSGRIPKEEAVKRLRELATR